MKTCKRSKSKYYTNLLHPRNPQLLILLPFQILQFLGSGFGKEDYLGMPDTIRLQGKNLLVADSFIWA